MNWPARIYIKLFASGEVHSGSEKLIAVFQRWIRDDALPGTWIDVVDYGHIHHGPGVVLAGLEGHLMWDSADGRPGLLYQSRQSTGLRPDLSLLIKACQLLESAPEFEGRLTFGTSTLVVGSNDRLAVGGTPSERDAWTALVLGALQALEISASAVRSAPVEDSRFALERSSAEVALVNMPNLSTIRSTLS